MAFTLAWWQRQKSPSQQLVLVLGGTGVRLAFVLLAGVALYAAVPALQHDGFWLWLVIFYLLTLAMESKLLLAPRSAAPQR
jgi:hypothetical protein